MKENIKKLAESTSIREVQDVLRCGFELEFQEVNGKRKGNGEGDNIDWEAVSEAISDRYRGISFEYNYGDMEDDYERLAYAFDEAGIDIYGSVLDPKLANKIDCARGEIYGRYRENEEENGDWSEYTNEGRPWEDVDCYRQDVECKDDSSVSGGEVATNGGKSPLEFLKISRYLFDNNEFEIDERCSFHIHLSVAGVDHYYGERTQAEMLAYLIKNIDRLPQRVVDRINVNHRHYEVKIKTDKFNAIHYHSQGTWEFRLFGNVTNQIEAQKCLQLAYEALRHAYQCKLDPSKRLIDDLHKFKTDLDNTSSISLTGERLDNKSYKENLTAIGA